MKVVFHEDSRRHRPRHFLVNGVMRDCPEVPGRCDVLLGAARGDRHEIMAPDDHGLGPIAAIHTAEYLAFLERVHERWRRIEGASEDVLPNIHPMSRGACYPKSAVGQHHSNSHCQCSNKLRSLCSRCI